MVISFSKIVFSISMLLTIFVALQFQDGESNPFRKKRVFVYITSNLTDTELGLHCKDKDTDFGYHTLKFGETYSFSFRPRIFLEAELYFCGFHWMKEIQYFDIYVEVRDDKTCKGDCHWTINKSAPCNVRDGDTECFNWNPKNATEGMQFGEDNGTLKV
ncbi:putative plant self-incompatibility S1 [Medicago truncatula]|uniref:S-protein homolog n=1 Tax=Medicago truncatula TaxID=3880 RepID=A0A396GRV1_MEDTR|nr:putative plant self-incompatibility S1 [Medicago truncatula]